MTGLLFQGDAYARTASGVVTGITSEGGIVLDQSLFYPTGGGQPGDSGQLIWGEESLEIATTRKGDAGDIVLVPTEPAALPPVGQSVHQHLDWDRRFGHMRVHSALHLLSVVVPCGVTGGSISETHGRLDFDMPDAPPDTAALEAALADLIATDATVTERWISEAELDANPGLVKTMSVQPPRGAGDIRLVQIGSDTAPIDLQPCGGTHVARLGEIGAVSIGKIQKKGRMNRRIYLHLGR